jgi:DNA-binding MarR family transcriptional regulator
MPARAAPADPPFPPYQGTLADLSSSVGRQMALLVAQMRREVERRVSPLGLTDAQWRPLLLLAGRQADTANELARQLEMDAGAVTRLLDRLEAKGLVERLRSDADRRVVHLRLSAAGQAAAAQVPQVLADVNNDFLQGFSAADWTRLLALIERMARNGNALAAERDPA